MKKIFLIIALTWCGFVQAQMTLNQPIVEAGQFSVDNKQYKLVSGKHVPYADAADFLTTIPSTRRHVGEIAYVYDSSNIVVWQFVGGIADSNFRKVSGGITDTAYILQAITDSIAGKLNINDTTDRWVNDLYFNATKDSLIFFKGGQRIAVKAPVDSFKLQTPIYWNPADSTIRFKNDSLPVLRIVADTSDMPGNGVPTLDMVNARMGGSGIDTTSLSDRIDANTTEISGKQDALTLTTIGTSGAATLTGGTLNIPNYETGGGDGNDTAIVHIDSVAGHSNWVTFLHSNRTIAADTLKLYQQPTIISFAKNATKDSIIVTLSDGTQMAVKDSAGSGGGSSSLSSITAATAPNTIDNGSLNKQEWQWNALDTTTAFKISSNSTGTTAGGPLPKLVEIALSGANAKSSKRTYAAYITNTHTGTTPSNVALYAEASGGTNNIAASFVGSYVSISTSEVLAPVYMLDVRGSVGTSNLNTGTINPYSGGTTTNLTGFVTANKGIVVPNYSGISYDYTRANGVGYAAIGNNILSTSYDTSLLLVNNNSTLKKIGVAAQNLKISDSSVVDASQYNYNRNAILDLQSTTKAFIPPRLTTAQRDAMVLDGVGYGVAVTHTGGYLLGTYINISLTGGTGSGAAARIESTGGVITRVVITTPGNGYSIGDVLTASLPGGVSWDYTITQLTGVPGMMIFNKTTGKLNFLNNSLVWEEVTSAP